MGICARDNKKYAESQALKADLVESAPKAQGQMFMKLEGRSAEPHKKTFQSIPWEGEEETRSRLTAPEQGARQGRGEAKRREKC